MYSFYYICISKNVKAMQNLNKDETIRRMSKTTDLSELMLLYKQTCSSHAKAQIIEKVSTLAAERGYSTKMVSKTFMKNNAPDAYEYGNVAVITCNSKRPPFYFDQNSTVELLALRKLDGGTTVEILYKTVNPS